MKSGIVLALLLAAGSSPGRDSFGPDLSPARTSFASIAAETGGALLGSALAAGLGYFLNQGLPGVRRSTYASPVLSVGFDIVRYLPYAMVPTVAAGSADWVGRSMDYPGTLWHAVVGSIVIGGAGAYAAIGSGLAPASDDLPSTPTFWAVYAGASSLGAVLGYETGKLFSSPPLDLGALPADLELPSVGMRPMQNNDGGFTAALDFRLISARF